MAKARPFRLAASQETISWLVLLLLAVVVLIPTACVLWIMTRAVQNERLGVRQRLGEACRSHLSLAQTRLLGFWETR